MEKIKFFLTALLVFVSFGLMTAQNRTVTVKGNVTTAVDGQPAPGAYVSVEGTKIGSITDLDGNFQIDNVPASAKWVVVTYMGYKDARVAISANIKVALEDDAEMLEGAIATGMYKVDRRLNTGSVAKLDAAEAKLDGIADVSRSLEGRVAGVSVQNVSGTFGTAPKIRVRGATSIYGSSKPLWVVDGVIMEDVVEVSADDLASGDANTLISSAIAGLNSDDIESFDILKDGSATSIYGARAMAGVIVVTTKKGKAGQSHLSYTGEYTMRLKPSYSTFNIMNSQDQMSIYQELEQKGFLNYAETATAMNSGVYGKMYQLISTYDPVTGKFGLPNTDAAKAAYLRAAEYRNTDWFAKLFTYNIQHNHSVSMSGGTEKANYYASASFMDDKGWTLQSSVKRYTLNLNATYNISDKISLNIIGNGSHRSQKAPGTLNSEVDPVSGEVKRDFDINPYSYALNTSRTLDAYTFYTRNYAPFNILHELENNYMDINVNELRVQGELKYKPIKGLEFSVLGATKNASTSQEHFILDLANQALAYRELSTTTIRDRNPFLYKDPDNPFAVPVSVLPYGGFYERRNNEFNGWDFRSTVSYGTTLNNIHILNFFSGVEVNNVKRHADWFRGWGLLGDNSIYDYNAFKKSVETNSDYYTLENGLIRSVAFFGNATYSYKGKYNVNGTVRYEGTNRLGKARSARWLPTWNISGSWNAHEETFMKDIYPTVSQLTLKASYSLTGDRGPASVTNAEVNVNSTKPWRPSASVKEPALYIVDVANYGLTYEKKHELNFGVETAFLDNMITFAADWYKRNNFDLIGPIVTEGVGGQIEKKGNVAEMKSDGFEVSVSSTNIKTKDFRWTTSLVYSHSYNEITRMENKTRMMDLISGTGFARTGYPVRSLFSIRYMGLNDEGLPTFINEEGDVTVTEIYFQERDSDKLANLEYSGSVDPTDVGSLGNMFSYKGFKLNVFMTFSFGNVIRLDPVFDNEYDDLSSTPKEFANRWALPGDEAYTNIPVIVSNWRNEEYRKNGQYLSYAYNAYNYSTERIAKGDFIRMKEISLSYDLPKKATEALGVNSLGLKLQATNLFLIYSDKKLNGQDPEFFNTGGVAVPLPKQFTLTLRIGL